MTWFRWWHKHIRLHFKPKSIEEATILHGRLSLLYGFIGWNIIGFGFYGMVKNKRDSSKSDPEEDAGLSPGQKLATDAKIMNFRGFKLIPSNSKNVTNEPLKE